MLELGLRIKPFGKDGIRILYTGGGPGCTLEVHKPQAEGEPDEAGWTLYAETPDPEGVIVAKGKVFDGAPKLALWRLHCGDSTSEVVLLSKPVSASAHSANAPSSAAAVLPLDDAELAFNILQWFGTAVIDCRPRATHRLRESMLCADAAAASSLPPKDDAIAIGAPDDVVLALTTRARRSVHVMSERALTALCAQHPCLAVACAVSETDEVARGAWDPAGGGFSAAATAAARERRPVLPNLVDGALLVGHQGHALCIADWQGHVRLGGVLNLAPAHVDASKAREVAMSQAAATSDGAPPVPAWNVLELHCPDGAQLTDKPGDGQRLLDALPAALAAIRDGTGDGRLVFLHCQQGRSRAGSIATAHLLSAHGSWTLFDAIAFLSARRPEVEIFEEYAQALERWAVDTLGRPASLPRVMGELPRQIRPLPRRASQEVGGGGAAPQPASADAGAGDGSRPPLVGGKGAGVAGTGTAASTHPPQGRFGPAAIRRASPPQARK